MNVDLENLGEQIAEQAARLDAATHHLLRDLREFDQSGGWYAQGARSCAAWLSWRVGWNGNTAREHVRVAQRLGDLPLIDEALRRGEVSYSKVRAMTRVATAANEALLLEDARLATGNQLETICRKYAAVSRGAESTEHDDRQRRYLSKRELSDGMVRIEAILHPEEAAIVWEALTQIAHERATTSQPASSTTSSTSDMLTRPSRSFGPPATEATMPDDPSDDAADVQEIASLDNRSDTSSTAGRDDAPGHAHEIGRGSDQAKTAAPPSKADAARADATPVHAQATSALAKDTPFSRADALVTMAQAVLRGDRPDRSPTELVVTIAADVLDRSNLTAEPLGMLGDGTCVSAETARRLGCDAGVVCVHEDAHGTPLSVGRKTRSIPASIKRALLRRDGTCQFPGCDHRTFVEGHHIAHWADGGETSLTNLVTVCSFHHRFVHEYGFTVSLDTDQVATFLDLHGRPVRDVPPPAAHVVVPVLDADDWRRLHALDDDLGISAESNVCGWDGLPVNYSLVIDDLVRAEPVA